MGGLPHELGGTGFGIYHATQIASELIGLDLKGASFAVEGFGSLGKPAAKYMVQAGARFVGVSDSQETTHNDEGLAIETLEGLKNQGRSVTDYALQGGGRVCIQRSCDHILDVEADILITAARPDLITYGDIDRLHFKLIVEGSNLPMSFSVENLCHQKGITIVPDIVANAGGVISSYVEHIGGNADQMFEMIEQKIVENRHAILIESNKRNRLPKKAALNLAKKWVRERRQNHAY